MSDTNINLNTFGNGNKFIPISQDCIRVDEIDKDIYTEIQLRINYPARQFIFVGKIEVYDFYADSDKQLLEKFQVEHQDLKEVMLWIDLKTASIKNVMPLSKKWN